MASARRLRQNDDMVGSLAAFALARGRLGRAGALTLLGGAAALGCGGRSHTARGTPDSASMEGGGGGTGGGGSGSDGGTGTGGATSTGGAGMATAGAPGTLDYTGVVLASVMTIGTTRDFMTFAQFAKGQEAKLDACSTCCCTHSIGLSLPSPPPDAGAIELATADDTQVLASLVPDMGTLQGSWLFNYWGIPGVSDYAAVVAEPWAPLETLRVTATGNAIHAFTGEVRTGAALSVLTPKITDEAVGVDRAGAFELAWAPESDDEWVTLLLQQSGNGEQGFCLCSAPDNAGSLTVPSDEVQKFGTGFATVQLMRSIAAITRSDNTSVTLVSQVGVVTMVEFH